MWMRLPVLPQLLLPKRLTGPRSRAAPSLQQVPLLLTAWPSNGLPCCSAAAGPVPCVALECCWGMERGLRGLS